MCRYGTRAFAGTMNETIAKVLLPPHDKHPKEKILFGVFHLSGCSLKTE